MKKNQKGFSLAEVVVTAAILTFAAFAITQFGRGIFFMNSGFQQNLAAQMDARRVIRTMVAELRSASPSNLGAFAVAQAGTSTLTFYSNTDGDQYKERIRYFLDGTTLKRGAVKPSGNPLSYNPATEKVETMIRNVSMGSLTPIFEYFDNNYTGTSSPLSYPVSLASIRFLRITVIIDADSARPPGPIKATSQVTMRNLKDNL